MPPECRLHIIPPLHNAFFNTARNALWQHLHHGAALYPQLQSGFVGAAFTTLLHPQVFLGCGQS